MRVIPQHPEQCGTVFLHASMQTDVLWDMFEKIDSPEGDCFASLSSNPDSREWNGIVKEEYSVSSRVYSPK